MLRQLFKICSCNSVIFYHELIVVNAMNSFTLFYITNLYFQAKQVPPSIGKICMFLLNNVEETGCFTQSTFFLYF